MIRKIKVWHVDGSAECLDSTGKTLTSAGFEVTSQISGAYAYGDITTPGKFDFDVALVDYSVRPDGFRNGDHLITGLDLIELIKSRYPNRPLVISTSTTERDLRDVADIYLKKPIHTRSELVEPVRMMGLLGQHRAFTSDEIADAALECLAQQRGKDSDHFK